MAAVAPPLPNRHENGAPRSSVMILEPDAPLPHSYSLHHSDSPDELR